ncbi:MAG: hypothetical protein IEMM0006_2087 [bacterium]|nr:MAG: hypothetical protein IEMM0006_2087 [bacterium]
MEWVNVKALLERFYAGETSREEEISLREFFSRPDVPEELQAAKEHFLLLMQWQSESPLDDSFDEKIMHEAATRSKPEKYAISWYALAGVAASVLLVLALWLGNVLDTKSALPGTTNNPALAYTQTRTVLQIVSKNLNAGLLPAEKATRNFRKPLEKAGEIKILNTSVKPMKKLEEIERVRQLMESVNSVYINLEPIKK